VKMGRMLYGKRLGHASVHDSTLLGVIRRVWRIRISRRWNGRLRWRAHVLLWKDIGTGAAEMRKPRRGTRGVWLRSDYALGESRDGSIADGRRRRGSGLTHVLKTGLVLQRTMHHHACRFRGRVRLGMRRATSSLFFLVVVISCCTFASKVGRTLVFVCGAILDASKSVVCPRVVCHGKKRR